MEKELPKKKNTGLIITLIILILIILGLVGYICYDKGLIFQKVETKEEKKDNKKQEKTDKEEISVAEESTIEEKVKELSENFADYYPLTDKQTIKNQDLLAYSLHKIGYKDSFTKEEVEESIKSLFGNDMKVKHEDIDCPTSDPTSIYLYEDGIYTPNPDHGGHGGSAVYTNIHEVSLTKKDNKITAQYKILYATCGDVCILASYYKSYKDIIDGEYPILEWDMDEVEEIDDEVVEEGYQRVKDKIPTTTFEFTVESDGTYTLNSIKIN